MASASAAAEQVSELVRIAKMGSVEPYRGEAEGIAGVLVCPQTKSGEPLRTAVSAEVLDAGKRLMERKRKAASLVIVSIRNATEEVDHLHLPRFKSGDFLRCRLIPFALLPGMSEPPVLSFVAIPKDASVQDGMSLLGL